jgi:hypothetical protein
MKHKYSSWTILGVFCVLLLVSCESRVPGIGLPRPEVKSVEFYPKHFCSGDELTFDWELTGIDRIELLDKDGRVLYYVDNPPNKGSGTSPKIYADMTPLYVRAHVGDKSNKKEVKNLLNIDNPQLSIEYTSVSEIPHGQPWVDPDPVQRMQVQNEDGEWVEVGIYEVRQRFAGFHWEIPYVDFASTAKMNAISNLSNSKLTFTIQSTYEEIQVAGGQADQIQNETHPWGVIEGMLDTPREEIIAYETGERKKPPDPWFKQERVYYGTTAGLKLRVYCQ